MKKDRDYGKYGSFVDGNDPMIGRDSHAGLPEEKVMKAYPKNRMYPGGRLNDSITGIDALQSGSVSHVDKHLSNQK